MARHRAVLRWLMQFRLANSLPSSTLSAIQSLKKEIPDYMPKLSGATILEGPMEFPEELIAANIG